MTAAHMSTTERIQARLRRTKAGTVITTGQFLRYGTRASVDQALTRLARAGHLNRIARGVYAKPGAQPSPHDVATAIAHTTHSICTPDGPTAAALLGLGTTPAVPGFITTGPTRRLSANGTTIELRHVSPRKTAHAGTPVGLALTALRHLGRQHTTPAMLAHIREQLGPDDYALLRNSTALPSWLATALTQEQAA